MAGSDLHPWAAGAGVCGTGVAASPGTAGAILLPRGPEPCFPPEGSVDAEKQINVLPTLECDGSEDWALLGRMC